MRFQLLYFVFSILLLIDFPLVVHNEDFSDSRRILNPKWNFPRPVIQDSPPQDTTESSSIGLEALSPYEIAKLMTDGPWSLEHKRQDKDFSYSGTYVSLEDIWNQLGIHSLHLGYEKISTDRLQSPDQFLTSGIVDVKTYTDELDGEPGNEVLLRVSNNSSQECRYVLFKPLKRRAGKPRWKLLGYIDHDFGQYQMPEHSIAQSGGRKWLMVRVQVGAGTGYVRYDNRLFSVDHTGLKEILQFPSEEIFACCDNYPAREFKTKLVRCEMSGATTTVIIDFLATWWVDTDGDIVELWKKKQRARYQTDPISQKLTLDPSQSDFGEEEFKAMYDAADDISREDFIFYNLAELSRIALEPENPRKNWLAHFLAQVDPSPEKEKLENLICQ